MTEFFNAHSKRDVFLWVTGFAEASMWVGLIVAVFLRHDWFSAVVILACLVLTIRVHVRFVRESPSTESWLS